MDIQEEIARQVELLPPSLQEQVLRFVASLQTAEPIGKKGAALLKFAGTLDPVSAREMNEAIERECEQVDSRDW